MPVHAGKRTVAERLQVSDAQHCAPLGLAKSGASLAFGEPVSLVVIGFSGSKQSQNHTPAHTFTGGPVAGLLFEAKRDY